MRGARGLVYSAISVLSVLGLGAAAAPAWAAQAAVNYVALGDSYSAGVGADDYDDDSGSCKRSANSYPQLWADSHDPASFQSLACLGAHTAEVRDEQLSALNADTTLVTLSVGGNDAGFTDVFVDCTLGTDDGCVDRIEEAKTFVRDELPARLDELYRAIAQRAPAAQVVVLGYPRIYQLGGSCNGGLSEVKREAINGAADTLDDVIAQRAEAAGHRFVDVREIFDGHGICSGEWWLKSLSPQIDESYHPNKTGQSQGYLASLNAVTG